MKIPSHVFPEVVPPATQVGALLPEVAEEIGSEEAGVMAVASHDTASAVVAVPAEADDFAYISSGTWSLVGLELPEPVVTPRAMEANFTNEGGFGGTTRFLKNVMGLWLLQECRREWARAGREYAYEDLERMAAEAAPGPFVDPDHPSFLAPGDMTERIRRFCEATGQRSPEGPGEVVRCVFESLALKYRLVLEQAAGISGRSIEAVHIVGGGSRSGLLCRLTAGATGRTVISGPAEATALGNLMVQVYAGGHVGSLSEIRAVVRRSVETRTYEPGGDEDRWRELRERFADFVEAGRSVGARAGGADD